MVEEIKTYEQFANLLKTEEKPILADLFATWCGPCRMQAPIVDEFAEENPEVKVVKVDVDENPQVAIDYKVASIPTLLFIKNGELKQKSVGLTDKQEIKDIIEKYL